MAKADARTRNTNRTAATNRSPATNRTPATDGTAATNRAATNRAAPTNGPSSTANRSPANRNRSGDQDRPLAPLIVPRWLPATSLALVIIGLALSAYLTYEHYSASATLACSDNGVVNCLQVTTSAQSKVFGIPVALLGLLYFVAMLPACLPVAWRSRSPWLRNGRTIAGIVGIGFVFYLLYSELFTIGKICLYCTGVHVVTVALFAVVAFGQASISAPEDR
jgi:uncharacterized membrane protein